MKYAFLLVFLGVASGQFQQGDFRDFDNQRNNPQQNQPQTTFDRPQVSNQPQSGFDRPQNPPFRNTFNNPTPRPATTFQNNPNRYQNQPYNTRNEAAATIVKQYFDDQGDGSYSWGFQNSDGTERQERIYFKNAGDLGQVLVKEGFYSYYDSDGRLVKVSYRADENGFQISEDNRLVALA